MQALAAAAPQARGRRKWLRMELALLIVEATGRRIGSLRGLRWADWDFERPAIRWRAEFDKRRRERTVPIPRELADHAKALRIKLEAFGDGWLFSTHAGEVPWPRHLFDQGLRQAERRAGLTQLEGSLWHAYRRKWATERKHLPRADVKAVGGWQDDRTLDTCYQQAEQTVLEVVNCPTKLMSKKSEVAG